MQVRSIIAKRLLESKLTAPSLYVSTDVQLDALTELRKTLAAQVRGRCRLAGECIERHLLQACLVNIHRHQHVKDNCATGPMLCEAHFYPPWLCALQTGSSFLLLSLLLLLLQGTKVSVNDFVMRAAALALKDTPQANAFWDAAAGASVQQPSVDVCVAVATDGGLITPIVKAADTKSLTQVRTSILCMICMRSCMNA
jgi:hypothetical protein